MRLKLSPIIVLLRPSFLFLCSSDCLQPDRPTDFRELFPVGKEGRLCRKSRHASFVLPFFPLLSFPVSL